MKPNTTNHQIYFSDARNLGKIDDASIHLIVTSPPYPMIEMWDDVFGEMNPQIQKLLSKDAGAEAFECMHQELDKVWREAGRVLIPGGMLCINVGDSTRNIAGNFQLFSNHARILQQCLSLGFQNLPNILWRKPTNSPTKFMGSGMLPPGAYVTLEHEYILIFRKGNKREFRTQEEKHNRRESAFFWEERNKWFSDVWMDLKGIGQELNNKQLRKRSGAFPFELACRLINMFSVKGDTVVDPFLGTGSTMFSAMVAERNSVGYEIDPEFRTHIEGQLNDIKEFSSQIITNRVHNHLEFVAQREKPLKYQNKWHNFPVVSRQEKEIILRTILQVSVKDESVFTVQYSAGRGSRNGLAS